MEHLHTLRADTDKKRGISAQTFNFYLQACKQFCRWAVKDRGALENPLAHLDGLNVKIDRRRDRRASSIDELRGLLETTRTGPRRNNMEGRERALLYWLAVETGSNELRNLSRASFAFDVDPPTVTVKAAYSKHRREAERKRPECSEQNWKSEGTLVDSDGLKVNAALQCVDTEKTVVFKVFPHSGSVCTSGEGPGLQNQWGV